MAEHYGDTILQALFFAAFAVPAYSYFVFPVILWALVQFKSKSFESSDDYLPSVTLLISAYNEASVIREKIENSLALDYPSDKLQIVVIDDGSTDGTDEIAERFVSADVEHHRVEGRGGKNVALNKTWPMVKGDIVVFSDANSMYKKDAIRRLVARFTDERIGCVCGELRYLSAETGSALGENLYWKYEQYLKSLQSRMGEVLVLNGSIFAIRREIFRPLQPKIANDFQIPVVVASENYAIVYQPKAVATEKVAVSARDEFGRKARIIARGLEGFFHNFKHFRGIRLFQFVSQKFLRWNVWLAMVIMFVTNAFLLQYSFFRWIFAAQLFFYALACAGPILSRTKIPGIAIPYYFCIINLGALVGVWRFVSRRQKASWEPPSSAR